MRDNTEFKGKPDGVAWAPPDEINLFLLVQSIPPPVDFVIVF